jgi:autotransporter-associated beta strand protein
MKNNLLKKVLKSTAAKLIAAFLMLSSGSPLSAATVIWTGGSTSANWRSTANWGGAPYPVTGDDLVFAGSTRTSTSNNNLITQMPYAQSITFNSTASAFSLLGGYALGIRGSIVNNSSSTQTFNTMGIDLQVPNVEINTASGNIIFNSTAVISGSNSLTKSGNGTLTLKGNKTYLGGTTVNGGTLLVDSTGSIASSSSVVNGGLLNVNGTAGNVEVNSGGSFGGEGTVGAVTLKDGSFLKPGNSPGLLRASSSIWAAGSTYNWEINNATGTAGVNWDLFSVTGALDLSELSSEKKMNLVLESLSIVNFSITTPYSWVIAQAGSFTGNLIDGADVTNLFNINATAFNGGNLPANGFKVEVGTSGDLRTLNLMAIPEPSSGSLMVFAVASLITLRAMRKK